MKKGIGLGITSFVVQFPTSYWYNLVKGDEAVACYLLTHNPDRWNWEDIDLAIQELNEEGSHITSWSSGNRKNFEIGDRIFIIRLGVEPKGIIASGRVYNGHYKDISWDDEKSKAGILANYIDVQFDVILNPEKENILLMEKLKIGKLGDMNWSTQSSGITIPRDIEELLEQEWNDINSSRIVGKSCRSELLAEEIISSDRYFEGAVKSIQVNRYERSSKAREKCIEHHGYNCSVCEVNLKDVYGEIASEFIHVHHKVPLAVIGEKYEIIPIEDLVPICPNCHAIIHRYKPEILIEELKKIIKENKRESGNLDI